MAFRPNLLIAISAILVAIASGAVLRGEPASSQIRQASKPVVEPKVKVAVTDTKGKVVATPKAAPKVALAHAAVAVANKATPQDDAKTLEALGKGLKTIHDLRALFSKDKTDSPKDGSEKFAIGALSEELSNKDSQVWSSIDTMIGATQDAMKSIKGKSISERKQVMKSLEDKLDSHAKVLSSVNDGVSKKQMQQDEEYLLGLLLMHQNDWSMEKQLNATKEFMHNSPVMQKLYEHHDSSKPLAPQLAAMMDVKNKAGVAKVEENTAKMKALAAKVAAAAAKNAPIMARLAKEEQKEKAAKAGAAAVAAPAKMEDKSAKAAPAVAKVEQKAAKAVPTMAKTIVQETNLGALAKVDQKAAKVALAVAKTIVQKKDIGKAASAAARTLFIQLTDSIMNRDCPYCAAQCVDKCHTAGKPYVQCMTDCADAGK